jgi:hypothetical protein
VQVHLRFVNFHSSSAAAAAATLYSAVRTVATMIVISSNPSLLPKHAWGPAPNGSQENVCLSAAAQSCDANVSHYTAALALDQCYNRVVCVRSRWKHT